MLLSIVGRKHRFERKRKAVFPAHQGCGVPETAVFTSVQTALFRPTWLNAVKHCRPE